MTIEKRVDKRYPVNRPVTVNMPGGQTVTVKSNDLSISGISVLNPQMMAVGTQVQISLTLTLRTGFKPFNANCLVIHNVLAKDSNFRIGMKFFKLDIKNAAILAEFISYRDSAE